MLPARRQLPPPDPGQRQRGFVALSLAVLSLLGLAFGLGNLRRGIYVAVLTLLFAAVAVWLGVAATRRARRAGTARPRGAVVGIVLGGFGLALSALWLLVLAVFWPQLSAYYNCMSGANTVTAQQACHDQFTKSVGGEISILQNGRLPALRAAGAVPGLGSPPGWRHDTHGHRWGPVTGRLGPRRPRGPSRCGGRPHRLSRRQLPPRAPSPGRAPPGRDGPRPGGGWRAAG
jgi:hypothetical protein